MLAAFDDAAVVHHGDVVGVLDRGQTVGDHEGRAPLHQGVHPLLDESFRTRVDGRGRLVQDEHGRVRHGGAGDCEELALALRQIAAVGVQDRVVPVRETADKGIGMHQAGGVAAFLVRGVQAAVTDVVQHRTAEKFRFLEHDAEGAPEVGLLDACDAESVVGDRPVLDLVEPVDQVRDRGLARAGSADEGDLLAGIGRQGDVVEHLFFRHIAKVHIGQGHQAFQLPELSVRLLPGPSAFALLLQGDGAFVHFRGLVQERIQAVRTRGGHHDGIDFVGDLRDGPGEVALECQEPRIARSTYMKLPMLELIGMMMLPILLALYTLARSSSFKAANCSSALSSWQ